MIYLTLGAFNLIEFHFQSMYFLSNFKQTYAIRLSVVRNVGFKTVDKPNIMHQRILSGFHI